MSSRDNCIFCDRACFQDSVDVTKVRSNVRRWASEHYTVWRCPSCGSLHSLQRFDLKPFYEDYPFRRRQLDFWTRRVFDLYIKRLRRWGLTTESNLLDYGCGEGIFLLYLQEQGFSLTAGYDAFVSSFNDPRVLGEQFDFVIAQDVIEHVEEPARLFETFATCLGPGGKLCVGTPRADGINLADPERYIHSLHQPYHLHIFSEDALVTLASRFGFKLEKIWRRHVLDTMFPFVNWTFLQAYLRRQDNNIDAGFDEPRLGLIARSPYLLAAGIFGYLFPIRSELIALFSKVR